jgi:hypothetical protein
MAMVDASLVLDAIVAVSIAAGAFFAVIELRDMKKDRRTQLMLQACTHWTTREFEEALCKLYRANANDAKGLEKEVSCVDLYMITDFHWIVARLGLEGLVDMGTVIRIFPFSLVWNKVKPWVVAERVAIGHEGVYSSLEKVAQLQEKDGSYFDI